MDNSWVGSGLALEGFPSWVVDALMELQYRFPLVDDPYAVVAERIGVGEEELLDVLRRLKEKGILKRVGFYFNPRSTGRVAALIAFETNDVEGVAEHVSRVLEVTHSYERNNPRYRLWVVVRGSSVEEIVSRVREVCGEMGCGWLVLPGKKLYRLSVKYDLRNGVSKAGPYSRVAENPPSPEDLGYSIELARALRSLPLEPNPFDALGKSFGMSSGEIVEAAKRMLKAGILGDPGAALDGHKLGFKVNAMFVLEPASECPEVCRWVVDNLPEATHVVERSVVGGEWPYTCYFMVHATSEAKLEPIRRKVEEEAPVRRFDILLSLRDLKPGVVR